MSTPQLEHRLHTLEQENQALRAEIDRRDRIAGTSRAAKVEAVRFGGRVLIPLLDRQKVVRSFSKLARTVSGFTAPMAEWPSKDQVLTDARVFMESCVRFVIRRRMFLLVFSLIAATIPVFQVWLVVQQNRIIEKQNKFIEIQLSDTLGNALSDETGVGGVLLATADLEVLERIVDELFDPTQAAFVARDQDRHAVFRLEDAARRSPLVRAVARGVEERAGAGADPGELYGETHAMFQRVLQDTTVRLPLVFRLGDNVESARDPAALVERLDRYIYNVGVMLQVYEQLSRRAGQSASFYADIAPLVAALSRNRSVGPRFREVYQDSFDEFLFRLASPGTSRERPAIDDPDRARKTGLDALRAGVGDGAGVRWENLASQLERR